MEFVDLDDGAAAACPKETVVGWCQVELMTVVWDVVSDGDDAEGGVSLLVLLVAVWSLL